MARQTAEIFLERLAANRSLQTHQRLAEAWTVPALTRFAANKGFLFSEADLKVAMESLGRRRPAKRSSRRMI